MTETVRRTPCVLGYLKRYNGLPWRRRWEVALARKRFQEGHQNMGLDLHNGFGGKILAGESELDALFREGLEELGVRIHRPSAKKIASACFLNLEDDLDYTIDVEVWEITRWSGFLWGSKEMRRAKWFPIQNLPYHQMMPTDRSWLKDALMGWKLKVTGTLRNKQSEVVGKVGVLPVSELPEVYKRPAA